MPRRPAAHRHSEIELGYGGLVVDDLSWTARTYARPSFWGHRFTDEARATRPGILHPVT
ncbi:hypothetical protein [Gordonia malaquae]|uniref:hypothetical protein n=1 Tax=Gordonia malaquae TaxID=410332 RepID=UPI0030187DF6